MKDKIILIQGAMDIEVEYLISQLKNMQISNIAGYEFYRGNIKDTELVISKTLIGTINATMATTIGIINFSPNLVINQGIAGAHRIDLHVGDIVIGEKCCNINTYEMPSKDKGVGSNPFEWEPYKHTKDIQNSNLDFINIIEKNLKSNSPNNIYRGILGSGDVFNREIDRINWINNKFGNYSEDMESIGTYSVCNKFDVPCIGIRIISNNEITFETLDKTQAIKLQKLLINLLNDLKLNI